MAKKQTRRSISVSRTTYERLKAFCETNNISMSQLVETRVNDFLGEGAPSTTTISPMGPSGSGPSPSAPRPSVPTAPRPVPPAPKQDTAPMRPLAPAPAAPAPMTSAAARFAVDPPPPIIKQKQDTNAPKPAEKRPDQIFTF